MGLKLMINMKALEELRTKEELIEYFKQLGKEITEEEIIALKQSYEQADENRDELSLQQLDDVVGGVFMHIVNSGLVSIASRQYSIFRFKDGEQINNGGLSRLFDLGYTRNFSVAKTSATRILSQKELIQMENETLQIAFDDANSHFAVETINLTDYNAHLNQDQVGRVILVATGVLVKGNAYMSSLAKENLCRFLVHNSDVRNEWMKNALFYQPAVQPTVSSLPPAQKNRLPSVVTPNNAQPNAQASANVPLPTGAFGRIPFIQKELEKVNSNSQPMESHNIKDYSVFNPSRSELRKIEKDLVGRYSFLTSLFSGNNSSSSSAKITNDKVAVGILAGLGMCAPIAASIYGLTNINNKNKDKNEK